MPKIKFAYHLKKDAWSWVLIAKNKNIWGLDWRQQVAFISDKLLRKIQKNSFPRAQKIVERHIKNSPLKEYKDKIRDAEMGALAKSWRLVEKKYFATLAKITQRPIYTENIGCYFTTGFMCPYNQRENWFMVSLWHSIPASITTICHEVMHLQFLHYYQRYLKDKGLKSKQIGNLKEALTFLLNEPEFDDIILCQDNGYPEHRKLRKKLKNIWVKNKDFKILLDEAVRVIKNKII